MAWVRDGCPTPRRVLVDEIVEAQLEQMAKVRDGTSRFPTSNAPAPSCDLDHTVPYDYGGSGDGMVGWTEAANLGAIHRRE